MDLHGGVHLDVVDVDAPEFGSEECAVDVQRGGEATRSQRMPFFRGSPGTPPGVPDRAMPRVVRSW